MFASRTAVLLADGTGAQETGGPFCEGYSPFIPLARRSALAIIARQLGEEQL